MKRDVTKNLIGLAYIKSLWDSNQEKNTIIDVYLPYLVELIKKRNYTYIESTDNFIIKLSDEIEKEFGIRIPLHPMKSLLDRARKKKILTKESRFTFIVNKNEIYKDKYRVDLRESERKINNLIDIIENYAIKLFSESTLKEVNIGENLLKFIDRFSESLFIISTEENEIERLIKYSVNQKEMFIISKVIIEIYEKDENGWNLLQDIVVGSVLTKLLLYDPNAIHAKLNNLTVYLDTRIIFRILGIEGDNLKKSYIEFINELKNQEAKLRIFYHTYEEILNILRGAHKWIDNPNYDPSKASLALRHFKQNGMQKSDIALLISNLEEKLREKGIEIDYKNSTKQIDDSFKIEIKDEIISVYEESYNSTTYYYTEKEESIEKDAMSISLIYLLRDNPSPSNLKRAKYIFVTPNIGLTIASKRFHEKKYKIKNFYIPACVTDTFIGTIIWLNNPFKINKTLDSSIISTAMSFLKHGEEFIKKWQDTVKSLREQGKISEEDFVLLRDSQIAMEFLDEKTLGDPESITSKTALEILHEIKEEAYKKYKEEESKHKQTLKELEIMKKKEEKRKKRIDRLSENLASYTSKVLFGVLVLLFLCLTIYLYIKNFIILAFITAFLDIVFIYLGYFEITHKTITNYLKERLRKYLENLYEGG